MKIILVYAGSPDSKEIQSPFCITKNLHKYLSERAEVEYYQWDQVVTLKPDPNAIFIGHPHYNPNTVVQSVFRRDTKFKAKCSIHPFHHADPAHNSPFHDIARKADKIFSICGPYWYDTAQNTEFAFWKEKMVRLDMAVDGEHFPYLKQNFNPPGKRKILYMGSDMPMKNVGYLTKVMQKLPNTELHWYGANGEHSLARLPNVKAVGWTLLNKPTATRIVNECDIMVNVSTSDANPTTLLEARAWGLITACSKTSGYYNDKFFTPLTLGDPTKTAAEINHLLTCPTAELEKRSKDSRKEIETKYNWDVFCSKIWNELVKL